MSVVMHLFVCPYVCNCMRKNLYICKTPMYFRYIYYFVVIVLWGVSQGEMHIVLNFGEEIQIIKGFTKMDFTVIMVGSNVWIVII